MLYACVAPTKEGARCHYFVEKPGELCEGHKKMKEEGKEIKPLPLPDTILVKFNINPGWAQLFEQAGIPRRSPDEVALEEKHIDQARQIDRKAYRFRDIADSGVPVFGPQGVSEVSISGLLTELGQAGYQPQGIHIRTRNQKKFDVLVIPFTKETQGGNSTTLPKKAVELLREFLRISCWGFAHVWANPPEAEKVTHTVNLGHREEKPPQWHLQFNHGLWAVEP